MTKQEAIQFCRTNTMRRTSVLGYAQINCPLAYEEYFKRRNPFKSLHEYFNMIWGYKTKYYYDLKSCFDIREEQLIRENKKLPQKYDNVKYFHHRVCFALYVGDVRGFFY